MPETNVAAEKNVGVTHCVVRPTEPNRRRARKAQRWRIEREKGLRHGIAERFISPLGFRTADLHEEGRGVNNARTVVRYLDEDLDA
jgi:hypothetical protein